MNNKEYLEFTRTTAVYPKELAIPYLALGLGEAGEVQGKVKKYLRGDTELTEEYKRKIFDECSDVLWYLTRLADELGFTLDELIEFNVQKLTDRKKRDVIKGSGDNR